MTKTQKCGVCGQEHEVIKTKIGEVELDLVKCPVIPENKFLLGSIMVTIS